MSHLKQGPTLRQVGHLSWLDNLSGCFCARCCRWVFGCSGCLLHCRRDWGCWLQQRCDRLPSWSVHPWLASPLLRFWSRSLAAVWTPGDWVEARIVKYVVHRHLGGARRSGLTVFLRSLTASMKVGDTCQFEGLFDGSKFYFCQFGSAFGTLMTFLWCLWCKTLPRAQQSPKLGAFAKRTAQATTTGYLLFQVVTKQFQSVKLLLQSCQ